MNTTCLLAFLFSGLLVTVAPSGETSLPSKEAQTDDYDARILLGTARELRESDIVLAVVLYKSIKTNQGTTLYGRVVQSLRGNIPVEALVKWFGTANKLLAGNPPKTDLYSDCSLVYVLASSKTLTKLPKATEDFQPANNVYDDGNLIASYDLGDSASYFPMTESDPGRAVKKLLHIEPARITEESEAARFREEEEK